MGVVLADKTLGVDLVRLEERRKSKFVDFGTVGDSIVTNHGLS